MNKLAHIPAALAFAGASFLAASPELAAAETGHVGPYTNVETFNLGLDSSGLPVYSDAPNNGDINNPLREHQGGHVEVTSSCDPSTGIGKNTLKLSAVSRPGDNGSVTWGIEKEGKEYLRKELTGGSSAIVEIPAGKFNAAWVEVDDTEGQPLSGTVYGSVLRLEKLAQTGEITVNTDDDHAKYTGAIVVPECVRVVPETTTTTVPETTTTTSTTVPETTTTTTTTTTIVEAPETTTPKVGLIPPKIVTRELANTGKNTAPFALAGLAALLAGLGLQSRGLAKELVKARRTYIDRQYLKK